MLSNLVAGFKIWIEVSRFEACKASIVQSIKEVFHPKKVGGVGTMNGSVMGEKQQPQVHPILSSHPCWKTVHRLRTVKALAPVADADRFG